MRSYNASIKSREPCLQGDRGQYAYLSRQKALHHKQHNDLLDAQAFGNNPLSSAYKEAIVYTVEYVPGFQFDIALPTLLNASGFSFAIAVDRPIVLPDQSMALFLVPQGSRSAERTFQGQWSAAIFSQIGIGQRHALGANPSGVSHFAAASVVVAHRAPGHRDLVVQIQLNRHLRHP
jgi:hypothetical protein